jgi:hypothetical protein
VGMGNVLSRGKREQVIALGRLGWSLRRIEQSTGVRREMASEYLCSAGIPLRSFEPNRESTIDFKQCEGVTYAFGLRNLHSGKKQNRKSMHSRGPERPI